MTFRLFGLLITVLQRLTSLNKPALLILNVTLSLLVGLLLTVKSLDVLLEFILCPLEEVLALSILNTTLVDKLISPATVLNSILPLEVELVALRV